MSSYSPSHAQVWILDERGREIEHREWSGVETFVWDDRDRCLEHKRLSYPLGDDEPEVVARREAHARLQGGDSEDLRDGPSSPWKTKRTLDASGNVTYLEREGRVTRFEYGGEFRNAICHGLRPSVDEWRTCDLRRRRGWRGA